MAWQWRQEINFHCYSQPFVLTLEVKDSSSPSLQTVHPVYAGAMDFDSIKRFIITARALDGPSDEGELEAETEHEQETTEFITTDITEEPTMDEQTHEQSASTESGLFTSTSAVTYTIEPSSTTTTTEVHESLVARTGEAADVSHVSSFETSRLLYFFLLNNL